ncbi:MAG TPA: sulfate reduction electron transfer complex DsrMKJOP subunit DsrJ [Desulfomonilia bacterium]
MKIKPGTIMGVCTGLAVFILIAAFPFWYGGLKPKAAPDIDLNTPEINALTEKQCVTSTEYMKTEHMKLLNQWRNDVVRNGSRTYIAPDGRQFDKSLTRTCLACHSNKEQFCTRCHNYSGANPRCWDCHSETASAAARKAIILKEKVNLHGGH